MSLSLGLLPGGLSEAAAETAVRAVPSAVSGPGVDDTGTSETAPEDEALARAKRSGKKIEVESLRGEAREVYATPDGRLEAIEHLRPVRARVGGEWKPVDTDLARTADGMVTPKVATADVAFSAGGDAPMVRMKRAGRELSLSWPSKLPTPTLEGETATYAEVLPGVDLRLSAEVDGFSQLLVVKSAKAAANPELERLRLKLGAGGVQVQETVQGGLEAIDEGAKTAVFEASAPLMWDSSAAAPKAALDAAALKASGLKAVALKVVAPKAETRKAREAAEPGNATREPGAGESGKLASIGVELPADGEELVLTPDREVLKGRDTVYPVYIDPQWHTARSTAWTMVSKYWANSPQWKFNGKSDEGLGFCEWSYCNPYDTKRLFYRIPTSTYVGTRIVSAEFVVRNTWSASCADRQVQLWRTKDISASTTWNSQDDSGFWLDKLATRSFAYGFEGCADGDAEFDVRGAVQEAANKKQPTMTFGLRASNESDRYAWKRFADKAHLRVTYNRPPGQIKKSQLFMDYAGGCAKPGDAPRVRTLDKMHANNVTDPDGDRVAVQFEAAWDSGDGRGTIARWKPGRTSAKKSGSDFSISLPSTIPSGKTISWYVRSWDGESYSPWSSAGSATSCYFVYDKNVPKAPGLSSREYPASDPEDPNDPWIDGIGKYGEFTIDSSSTDVERYRYGVNGSPSAQNEIKTSGGAPKVVKVLPSKPGLNYVTAQAFDDAGNASEIRTYQFRVKSGQPERAMWQMDEGAGAAEAVGTAPPRIADLQGGAVLGAPGVIKSALKLDGTTGYAGTDRPVVDTDRGFTVSAWVKLSEVPNHAMSVAAQLGNHRPGFELYYSSSYNRWVFAQAASDSPDAGTVRAMAAQPGGVKAGQWTHLVGSYDSGAQRLKLFVDGKQVADSPCPDAWNARRGLQIGAGSDSGKPVSFFPGTIDELQIFDKQMALEEVERLYAKERIGDPGRPAKAIFEFDEDESERKTSGSAGVLPARLHGGVKTGEPGVVGQAVSLDGTDDYARIGAPLVNSSRSFAVSLWARLPEEKPGRTAVAISQSGNEKAGFELYYSSAYDRWVLNQHTSDAADAGSVRAMQPECEKDSKGNPIPTSGCTAYADTWTHLVGVHDTVADSLTLYVNGRAAGSAKLAGAWYATGPMFIGAGSYGQKPGNFFPGQIDDVRLFDRPLSGGEVQQLFRQRPVVKARWNFESSHGAPAATSPNSVPKGHPAKLHEGAKIGAGNSGDHGLELDGVDDYAAVDSVPVDTGGSFTMTAWVRAAATPQQDAAVISAPASYLNSIVLRYVPDGKKPDGAGRWRVSLQDRDEFPISVTHVENDQFFDVREWNHIALAYDGFEKEARLYVNGELQKIACSDVVGGDGSSEPDCAGQNSWADDVLTAKSGRSLQIGRASVLPWSSSEHWPGAIDDVWAFQGALSGSQVRYLSSHTLDLKTQVPDIE
ncbi:LamG-like jellyroll fold domain-containing protein [Streptomyces sp. LX-29]|uniref:LamG-like jellyroll fold domain-containing protein n=1 Tax=Streptomyces sp. LX-29 TaxID=2900152 RepID=UPI00321A60E4